MASWMVHLRIADELLKHLKGTDETCFVVGNMAPDSGVPNDDWTEFDPPYPATHFKTETDEGSVIDTEKFRDLYFNDELIKELQLLPEKIKTILGDKEKIQWFASKYANAKDVFFIGRGIDYAISLEGSLKLKEISYIHSEAYAAGELKHGTISLIEDDILTVAVLTQPDLFEKTQSNVVEVKTRGAYVFALTVEGNEKIEEIADFTVYVPKTHPCFQGSLSVIPLQLFGYYVSVAKGLDADKPRNLAKSVTVE